MAKRNKIFYKDGFIVSSHIDLPLIDRVRILFGSRVKIQVETVTEFRVGHSQSSSTFIIEKLLPENFQKYFELFKRKNTMPESNFLPIKSSNLIAASYDGVSKCQVQFKNGTYEYEGVTPETWKQFSATFQSAESSGSYFNQNIKSLPFVKV
jgi:hypothetical protein